MTKMIFKNAWQYARKLANKLGGRPSEYIGYTLKVYWRLAKTQAKKSQVFVIQYQKKEDNYKGYYFTLGTNLKTKTNKQGEPYLSAITHKGNRNYKFYELRNVKTLKEWQKISKKLIEKGYELS